jgi:hypothetical protein
VHGIHFLLGEVEHRLGERTQLDELRSQGLNRRRKLSAEGAQRGARGLLARGFDQVGHRLGLRQIELALEERAAREFAGVGQPRPGVEARAQERLHHHGTAMAVQLEHRFPGVGIRRGEIQRESLVDRLAARIAKPGMVDMPWRRD